METPRVPSPGLLPRIGRLRWSVSRSLRNFRTLAFRYGQFRTMLERVSCDQDGHPVPWITYPAIQFISQLDFSGSSVFEYGSGYSSLFWAARCKRLVTVDDNREWIEEIRPRMPANAECCFRMGDAYPRAILERDDLHDVIVIDGSRRRSCAESAVQRLKDTGFIMLDNADWLPRTTSFLRGQDLIQVDMAGFTPINGYTSTTSFFLRRSVRIRPLSPTHPVGGPGSIRLSDPTADT